VPIQLKSSTLSLLTGTLQHVWCRPTFTRAEFGGSEKNSGSLSLAMTHFENTGDKFYPEVMYEPMCSRIYILCINVKPLTAGEMQRNKAQTNYSSIEQRIVKNLKFFVNKVPTV